jgi:hypothetical protein
MNSSRPSARVKPARSTVPAIDTAGLPAGADDGPPPHPPGTYLWLATHIARELVAREFMFATATGRWDRFTWDDATKTNGRRVAASLAEVVTVAAEVAAWLDDELLAQLDEQAAALSNHQGTSAEIRAVESEWRRTDRALSWLRKQQSYRGLRDAVKLARSVGDRILYVGPVDTVSPRMMAAERSTTCACRRTAGQEAARA